MTTAIAGGQHSQKGNNAQNWNTYANINKNMVFPFPPYAGEVEIQSHLVDETVADFVNFLEKNSSNKKPFSPKTRKSYTEWLRPFVRFAVISDCKNIASADVANSYLKSKLKGSVTYGYLNSVRTLLHKLFQYPEPLDPVDRKMYAYVKNSDKFIGQNRLKSIVSWAEDNYGRGDPLAIFILIMTYTGVRPAEARSLTAKDAKMLADNCRVDIHGKNGFRTINCSEDNRVFFRQIAAFADSRGSVEILGDIYGEKHFRTLFHNLQEFELKFTAPFYSPHCLRRAVACQVHRKFGMGAAKKILGHRRSQTTQRYIGIANEDLSSILGQSSLSTRFLSPAASGAPNHFSDQCVLPFEEPRSPSKRFIKHTRHVNVQE